MACLVHQQHCRLVHRKFPTDYAAGQKNIQGTGSRSGKGAQRRGKICPHQHSTCHLLESTFPLRRERDYPRQIPPQPRNPCGRFLVGFHRNLWLGPLPRETPKGLRRDSSRNEAFIPNMGVLVKSRYFRGTTHLRACLEAMQVVPSPASSYHNTPLSSAQKARKPVVPCATGKAITS